MTFSNVHFILYRPQLSENIGACARALKNFNFKNLKIVLPRVSVPNEKIIATSVGAKDIVKNCKVYSKLEDAIKNVNYVIATTSRKRKKDLKYISIKDLKKLDFKKKIAFIFGPEASGLTNNEISYANYVIKLKTNPLFESLNISHSLIIFCYELFNILNKNLYKKKSNLKNKKITKKKLLNFINFLLKSLDNIGFLQPKDKKKNMIENLRSIFSKMELTEKEIRILSSIFGSLLKKKVN